MSLSELSSYIFFIPTFLGCALFVSGLQKFISGPSSFIHIVEQYQLLPVQLAAPMAWMIVCAELGLGASLIIGVLTSISSALAGVLFGVFALGVALNLIKGRTDISCGCFGSGGSRISWPLALRNVAAAGLLFFAGPASSRVSFSRLHHLAITAIVAGLISIYYLLKALIALRRLSYVQ